MTILLSFSGKIGSGKDFLVKNVVIPFLKKNNKSYVVLSFANYLKQKLYTEYNVEYDKLYITKDEPTRKLLQKVGDEMRQRDINIFTKSVYINILNSLDFYDVIILSDTRFINEKKFLEGLNDIKTYTINIVSPNRTLNKMKSENSVHLKDHKSETELDNEMFNLILKNDYEDKDYEIVLYYFLDKVLQG